MSLAEFNSEIAKQADLEQRIDAKNVKIADLQNEILAMQAEAKQSRVQVKTLYATDPDVKAEIDKQKKQFARFERILNVLKGNDNG